MISIFFNKWFWANNGTWIGSWAILSADDIEFGTKIFIGLIGSVASIFFLKKGIQDSKRATIERKSAELLQEKIRLQLKREEEKDD